MSSGQQASAALARWVMAIHARLDELFADSMAWASSKLADRDDAHRTTLCHLRVLVVDDNAVNQTLTAALLSHWGIEPLLAADGAEAVALACAHELDLILMDLHMPVLDGWAATAQIRRFELEHARRRVPVMAYTSSAPGRSCLGTYPSGLDAVLQKPCSRQTLEACLTRWCADEFRLKPAQHGSPLSGARSRTTHPPPHR